MKIGVSDLFTIFIEQTLIPCFCIENQCDSDNEKEVETKKVKAVAKFDDEDQVDPEVLAKQKKEEARKAAIEA